MMTVSTIIHPSEFATHKERLVEILLFVENLLFNNAKILEDTIQNIKGLLSLSLALARVHSTDPPRAHHDPQAPHRVLDPGHSAPREHQCLGQPLWFHLTVHRQSVRKFKRIVEVNSNVHLPTYNCIIAEEARKKTLA